MNIPDTKGQKGSITEFKHFYKLGREGVLRRQSGTNLYVAVNAKQWERLRIATTAKSLKRFE